MLLGLLSNSLKEQGHFVAATDDAVRALRLVEEEDWDLVITDGALKSGCGEDFAIEAMERKADLPILLVTGSRELISESGLFLAVLRKPFHRDEFLKFVATALDRLEGTANSRS